MSGDMIGAALYTVTCNMLKRGTIVTCNIKEGYMGTPVRERMQKLRKKREGRSLSVWLYADTARMFKNIKTLTKDTNDAIVNKAIQEIYDTVFNRHCYELINKIQGMQNKPGQASRSGLTALYRELAGILHLDYPKAESIKKAFNSLNVPNYSGKTGTWRINQVRKFL